MLLLVLFVAEASWVWSLLGFGVSSGECLHIFTLGSRAHPAWHCMSYHGKP